MDSAGKIGNETIYFRCRKEAAVHNERLNSRAGAAELLGISESSLAKHELGITKVVPVDLVDDMAELYGCPELKKLAESCRRSTCTFGETAATTISRPSTTPERRGTGVPKIPMKAEVCKRERD